jgi:Predicted membrane protein
VRATWLAVVVLTALGAALRFATLDTQSFWLDELVTVSLLDRDFADMLEGVRGTEATPYLYYVLAWPWAQVFGLGEVGLRSLSAVVGTLAVPVSYAAGAALCSRRVGVAVAALVAVHPFLVWYAQEARSYSLLVLLGACVVLFLGRALRAPRRSDLALWAVASSLAIATHYFAVFLVVGAAAWLLARYPVRRDAVAALVLPAAVLVAHLPLVDAQRGNGETVGDTSLLSRVVGTPKALVIGYSFPWEIAGSVLAAALVAVGLSSVDATVAVPINELVQRQKRIVGALYGASNPRLDLPRIFALYLAGRLPLNELIGGRRPLTEVNEAYAELRSGGIGRTILLP